MSDESKPERRLLARTSGRVWEREILRVAGTFTSKDTPVSAAHARTTALQWANELVGGDLPATAWKFDAFEHLRGGRNCVVSVVRDKARDFWALRVDAPDKTVPQRSWTTEIVVAGGPAFPTMLSLRLLASSNESVLQIEPAVPKPIAQISRQGVLTQGICWFQPVPWFVDLERSAEDLLTFLSDPTRTMPVFVLSIAEGEDEPRMNAQMLAAVTVGIARVVVLRSECTWVLTRALGKQRSVFAGAARAYMPGFSGDADPFAHRLYLPETLADEGTRGVAERAFRWIAANESRARLHLGEQVIAFSAVREQSLENERAGLRSQGSDASAQLLAAESQIAALKDDVRRAVSTEEAAHKEWLDADEKANALDARLRGAEFRIQQLTAQLLKRGSEPDSDVELPSTWSEFADWCDNALVGRLTLTSRARREVRNPLYDDPQLTARCLLWLANAYRTARMEGGSGDLRTTIEASIRNERCGADAFDIEWEGHKESVEWHIKNGGNTHDPRRCLRIYYFWHEDTQRVVVASLPAHVRTDVS